MSEHTFTKKAAPEMFEHAREVFEYAREVGDKIVKLLNESRPPDLDARVAVTAEAMTLLALVFQFLDGQPMESQIKFQKMTHEFYKITKPEPEEPTK